MKHTCSQGFIFERAWPRESTTCSTSMEGLAPRITLVTPVKDRSQIRWKDTLKVVADSNLIFTKFVYNYWAHLSLAFSKISSELYQK